ncbi:hypothetical protein E5720_14675 [Rhodococcus sp. PAMC28707]|uniref:DUF6542 domain-containing protein n=1 Tax=unclassified Rhodococcus (in: high G+C Gram-positive bacteria) TaxID=192944 RepID=UPI00109DCD08|nr:MULTISPECIES: DUF6542 domain-containing protein [unclassified Rhodococcus (in: high G+C Gram-positive bacteria)]QCB52279.1 hypothetical protein E5769_20845 [Rhodococcus sp. PAMC28705]QCB59551.1 hypothetical protein E5720_14675 [Rhodococcus sp. PAMC28707]
MAIAGGASFLGFVIDAARGTELTSAFACFYIIGVVAAVVLVRYRGLFTALVQAPLILFVAVPMAYQYFTENPGTGVKDILLNAAIPLVNRFPLMLLGTVLAIGIGGARIYLKRQSTHAPTRSVRDRAKQTRDRTRASRAKTKNAPDSARSPEDRVSGRGPASDGHSTDGERRSTDARRPSAEGRRSRPSAEGRQSTGDRQSRPSTEGRRARRERAEPSYDSPAADPYGADPYRPGPVDADRSTLPPRRAAPRPPQPLAPRQTGMDPRSAPASAHVPPHPLPQVRYRDRTEP